MNEISRIQIGRLTITILQASCLTFFSVLGPWALWVLTTIIPVGFKNNEASAVSKLDHHHPGSLNLHRLTGGSRDIKMQIGGKCISQYWTDTHPDYLLICFYKSLEISEDHLIEMKKWQTWCPYVMLQYIHSSRCYTLTPGCWTLEWNRRFARCPTTMPQCS